MRIILSLFLGFIASPFLSTAAFAGPVLVTYFDRSDFLSDTGANNLSGSLTDSGLFGSFGARTYGDVTVSAPKFSQSYFTGLLPGVEIGVSDGAGSVGGVYNDGINITYASSVFSAGFDFAEPSFGRSGSEFGCNTVCVDSLFEVTVLASGVSIGSFQFNITDDIAGFVGVWSDVGFDSLQVRELVGTDDNEYYGGFYGGTTAFGGGDISSVPEPSILGLMGFGLLGLGWGQTMRRREFIHD